MSALDDVAAECQRHVEEEGWTSDHDDLHDQWQMPRAAAAYALSSFDGNSLWAQSLWPWDWIWWKPKSPRRDLIRAASLLIKEIERLDRLAEKAKTQET